jgi:hypothetical protein
MISLHAVSGPWTSFVAALDKGRFNIAVCRRYRVCLKCQNLYISISTDIYGSVLIYREDKGREDLTNRKTHTYALQYNNTYICRR